MSDEPPSEPDGWMTLVVLMKLDQPWAVRVAATLRLADEVTEEGRPIGDLAAKSNRLRRAGGSCASLSPEAFSPSRRRTVREQLCFPAASNG